MPTVPTSPQQSLYASRRSVTETILETLTQRAARPTLTRPAAGGRRRTGHAAAGVAMLAAIAALGIAFSRATGPAPAELPTVVARLEIARGPLSVLHAGTGTQNARRTVSAGTPIHAGAVVDTKDAGPAALRLAGGHSARLDADSRVRFASSSQMVLERGAVYVDSAAGKSVEVRTALGVVRDVGTRFEVRLLGEDAGASLRIRVREGSVLLEQEGESHLASLGEELRVAGDGDVERGTIPVHGPHWDWVLEAAPAPEIAGRPLEEFLDWASREGGWTVRYADRETARIASTTTLHGDVRGLPVLEASSMVLASSGLGYRLEDGTLWVGPRGGEER